MKDTVFKVKTKSAEFVARKLKKIQNPQVIIVNPFHANYRPYEYLLDLKHYKMPVQPDNGPQTLNNTITYNGEEYILDSILLANFNGVDIKIGHAIAGITCNDEHYGEWGIAGRGKKFDNILDILTGRLQGGPGQSSIWRIKSSGR